MTVEFQRAWTMPMRRLEPSCCCGVGPLRDIFFFGFWGCRAERMGGSSCSVSLCVCKVWEFCVVVVLELVMLATPTTDGVWRGGAGQDDYAER